MSLISTDLSIGLLLILPGIWLLWYANGHPEFYREKHWEKWHGRAALVGMFFSLICRYLGPEAVRRSFKLFAALCVGVGIWAILVIH